jgi:hypothetical protein
VGIACAPSAFGTSIQDAIRAAGADPGNFLRGLLDDAVDVVYMGSNDRLVANRPRDLLWILPEAQQGATVAGNADGARRLTAISSRNNNGLLRRRPFH